MKFQLKALVAALALVAAVPSQAAINASDSGNGSLVLSVFDAANNISALFDLGFNYSDFNVSSNNFAVSNALSANYTWDLTKDGLNNGIQGDYATAWSTFAATANEAGSSWAVIAADSLGAPGVGNFGYISTIANSTVPKVAQTTNSLVQLGSFLTVYTDDAGVAGGILTPIPGNYANHSSALNGASVSLINSPGYYLPFYNADKNNNSGAISVGAIDSSLDVIQRLSGTSGIQQTGQLVFASNGVNAKFNLTSTGQLSYTTAAAPIPEADTWAMMLLGLGFMGFVARRKQA